MAHQYEDNGASIIGAQNYTYLRTDSNPKSGSDSDGEKTTMARDPGKREASSFPHIITQRNVKEAALGSAEDLPFIQRSSAEPLIKEQLAEQANGACCPSIRTPSSSLDINSTHPRPATFAQATMSTNANSRDKSSITNDESIHARNTSMGSMPGSKLKLTKKKKWTRFPLGDISGGVSGYDAAAVDNASDSTEFQDVSGSDFEISRPATPFITNHTHVHAHAILQSTPTPNYPKPQSQHCTGVIADASGMSKSREAISRVSCTPDKHGEQEIEATDALDDILETLPTPTQKLVSSATIELGTGTKSNPSSTSTDTPAKLNAKLMEQDLDHLSMAGIAQAFASNDTTTIRKERNRISSSYSVTASNTDIYRADPTIISRDFSAGTNQQFGFGSNTFASPLSGQASTITSHQADSPKEKTEKDTTALTISLQVRCSEKLDVRDEFDSMDWDPAMSFGMDDSPEPVVAQPKKVEYTTVGSLVNSNNIPQLTAPNRIQREGAGRRSAMAMQQVASYQMGSYYHPRYATSSHGQQFTHNPVNAHFAVTHVPDSAYSAYSHNSQSTQPPNSLQSTNQEMEVFGQRGQRFPSTQASNTMYSNSDPYQIQDQQSNNEFPLGFSDHLARGLNIRDVTGEAGEFSQDRESIIGLSKMQTIQSLSKFDNPMRNLAQSRLQRFSITSVADPGAAVEALLRTKAPASLKAVPNSRDSGELNRAYRFPSRPPGFSGPSSVQSNPLYGVFTPPTPTKDVTPARGPQPLTAGPPGQRSYPPVPKPNTNSTDSLWSNDSLGHSQRHNTNSYGYMGTAAYASEYLAIELNPGPAVPRTRIVDTLDPAAAAKYYPNGRIPDIYQPLGFIEQLEIDRGHKLTKEDKAALNIQQIIYDNYEGQRRFGMTFEEYDEEFRQRQTMAGLGKNRPGPIQPPFKANEIKPITVDEMNSMPLVEAARPIFQAAYGSMLRYVDSSPLSDKFKSRYEASAEHLLDHSEEGNKSFFGEDWGKPKTQRFGRDPRYGTRGLGRP